MTDSSATELDDWRAARAHDPAAFARVFDRHRDTVFRQALRLMDQPQDAEEVAAAAFFELWRKRHEVSPVSGSVLPWLLVTTANLARNSHRVRMRRERFLRRLQQDQGPDLGAEGFERVDGNVVRADLVIALRQLKPRDVALVTMTALEGYSVREVAQLVGLSEGAARVRLSRARVRLRALLPPRTGSRSESQEVAK